MSYNLKDSTISNSWLKNIRKQNFQKHSVVLIGTLASYFAKYIKEHRWLGWLGIGVIFVVAFQLIVGGLDSLGIITINESFRNLFHV